MSTIGVYKNRLWQLRNSNSSGSPDIGYSFPSGQDAWQPLASYRGGMGSLSVLSMAAPQPTAAPVLPTVTPTATLETLPEVTSEVTAEVTVEATAEATTVPTAESHE